MEKRYTALRTIGTVYKIFGILIGVITVLLALGLCASSIIGGAAVDQFSRNFGEKSGFGTGGGIIAGLLLSLLSIIYGGGMSVTLYAMGEGIYLLIALEENTRAAALQLQQLLRQEK
jgi:hypothetical protein